MTMEDNKLIAEFMGYVYEDDTPSVELPPYHMSWDWLMPVVQKCYESGAEGDCIGDITMYLTDVDIKSTYKAVVEFIKQYNESNKMDTLPPSVQQG